jgi:hypothetical protein
MGVKIADGFMGGDPHAFHQPTTLAETHAVFKKWLGDGYDQQSLDAELSAAAVERIDGDPIWLLIVSGSGNTKTETVQALAGAGAIVTSTVSGEAALLSGTTKRDRAKDATGGLLKKIGDRGILVIKDVTSILSMSGDARAAVLAALREVYDGRWSRNLGTDGGMTIDWDGRIVVVGAVTTAWDRAHDVTAAMGDRFVCVRTDSADIDGRLAAGRKAIGNTGSEKQMRRELAEAVAGVINGMDTTVGSVTDDETEVLLKAANLVTLARTAVDFDYRGNVIDSHAPEMPTRFAKQLAQMLRGGVAIGMTRVDALRLAIRGARDSLPPLRLAIIDDVAANPGTTSWQTRKRLEKPRTTVDRQMQALHMLGVLSVAEEEVEVGGEPKTRWEYRLAKGIDTASLNPDYVPDFATYTRKHTSKGEETLRDGAAESGTSPDGLQDPPAESGTSQEDSVFFDECVLCGQAILLKLPGRDICERCRIDREREAKERAS